MTPSSDSSCWPSLTPAGDCTCDERPFTPTEESFSKYCQPNLPDQTRRDHVRSEYCCTSDRVPTCRTALYGMKSHHATYTIPIRRGPKRRIPVSVSIALWPPMTPPCTSSVHHTWQGNTTHPCNFTKITDGGTVRFIQLLSGEKTSGQPTLSPLTTMPILATHPSATAVSKSSLATDTKLL